jgi:hypothetical protein
LFLESPVSRNFHSLVPFFTDNSIRGDSQRLSGFNPFRTVMGTC